MKEKFVERRFFMKGAQEELKILRFDPLSFKNETQLSQFTGDKIRR